jgi:hypothetical protein
MGLFAERGRRTALLDRAVRRHRDITIAPAEHYVAIAERAAEGGDATVACSMVGRHAAREGADLGEALDELRATIERVADRSPSFEEMRALALAWSEETLSYVHRLSCEDPLTGLAGAAHLRVRLNETYRGALAQGRDPSRTHALVVVQVGTPGIADPFNHALWWVGVSEVARQSFGGEETMCSLGRDLLVVLVRRDRDLGTRIAGLRQDLARLLPGGCPLWIEGLPGDIEGAARVVDELLRR